MKIAQPRVKKNLVITGSVIVILGAAVGATSLAGVGPFRDDQNKEPSTDTGGPSTKIDKPSVNYGPPSKTDEQESQAAKQKLIDESQKNDTATASNVEVGIAGTYVSESNIEIRAFTPSVIEGGGTCTAIMTNGSATVTGKSESFIDATTSQCRPIIIPLDQFPQRGAWVLKVTYKSDKYEGTSPSMEVTL